MFLFIIIYTHLITPEVIIAGTYILTGYMSLIIAILIAVDGMSPKTTQANTPVLKGANYYLNQSAGDQITIILFSVVF